jgi:hypothetical protein
MCASTTDSNSSTERTALATNLAITFLVHGVLRLLSYNVLGAVLTV